MPLGRNFDYGTAATTLGLDSDWYENEDQMREDIAARWADATPAQRESFARRMLKNRSPATPSRAPAPIPVFPQGPAMNDHGLNQAFGGYNYANLMHGMQGAYLSGMGDQINQAMKDENDSRVAQAREQRRMEHEREIERMRQETEQMKTNALIQRLQASQQASSPYGPVFRFHNGMSLD